MPEQSQPPTETGRVIRFRPRGGSPSGWRWRAQQWHPAETPVADLSRYEQVPAEDDYRHRMMMNGLALAITSILVVAGVWLAISIADLRKTQDCVLMGRPNCAQVYVPPTER